MTTPEMQTANELDDKGLEGVLFLTDAIRVHLQQISELSARRKQLILNLRAKRITYKEIAQAMGVTTQLIYKIIKHDIDRTIQYDGAGNIIRHRGRPAKPLEEKISA